LSLVPWDVLFTARAEEWILGLADADYEAIMAAIELLEEKGPARGRPAVDRIEGSRHHNMTGWYERNIPPADDLYDEHLREEGAS
jgi:hypothetical protein